MTLPDERYRALINAQQFLLDVANPGTTKRVPSEIRQQARHILRHFPTNWDLDQLTEKAPDIVSKKSPWD